MKKTIVSILVIGMLLLTGIVSLSAVAKEETEKKELNTNLQGQQYKVSIFGGTSVNIRIRDSLEEHQVTFHFEVWKYNNHDGYEELVVDEWFTRMVGPNNNLIFNYKGYYFQGLNGRIDVTISIDGTLLTKSYGEYFFIATWGFMLHH